MFDQPELEGLLRTNLRRHNTVTLRSNVEVSAVTQDGSVGARGPHRPNQRPTETVHAEYVLGCDGANSLYRDRLNHPQPRLRAALARPRHRHHRRPRRMGGRAPGLRSAARRHLHAGRQDPVPVGVRLAPGETAESYREVDALHRLNAPWTKQIPADDLELLRIAEYTFRDTGIASRWRDRRVFLLGDAKRTSPAVHRPGMAPACAMRPTWTWSPCRIDPARDRARQLRGRTQTLCHRADPAGEADRCRHDRGRRGRQPAPRRRAATTPGARPSRIDPQQPDAGVAPLRSSNVRPFGAVSRARYVRTPFPTTVAATTTSPPAASP